MMDAERVEYVDLRGDRLLAARKQRGLRQADLAEAASVSQGYISQLESSARSRVTMLVAERLGRALNVSLTSLGGLGVPSPNAATLSSPVVLGQSVTDREADPLQAELSLILDSYDLPLSERELAEVLLRDAAHSIGSRLKHYVETKR